jgi:hypothetical protein
MGTIPKQYKKEIGDALIAESVVGWKVALLKSTFVYDSNVHVTYNDVVAFVVGGTCPPTGYAVTLSGAYSGTEYVVDGVDVTSGTGQTFADAAFAVLYRTSDGKIRDIKVINPAVSVVSGTFTLQWSGSGILKIA